MDKTQALQYLAQMAQDFINTLPVSAKSATTQMAQLAIDALKEQEVANKNESTR